MKNPNQCYFISNDKGCQLKAYEQLKKEEIFDNLNDFQKFLK